MLKELRAVRSTYQLLQTESRADTLLAVVTLAVVVGPLVFSWLQSHSRLAEKH